MTTRLTTDAGVSHISPMPGLPAVGIVHGFYVMTGKRGNGEGRKLEKLTSDALTKGLYDYAICTTAACNKAKQSCLIKEGWALLDTFSNSRSGEPHQVWGKPVHKTAE